MNMVILLGSAGMLLLAAGCSGNRQKTASAPAASAAPAVSQPARASTSATAPGEPLSLPVPSAGASHDDAWHSEKIKDRFSEGTQLKTTSLDGKYDLVILQEGRQAFLSFARHGRWESAHNQPAKGKLMVLRAKFEDGGEKRIEWDELGSGTTNLYGVVWSYPAKTGAPVGPVLERSLSDTVGGDELLIQDIIKHRAMLLEVEPGVTTQFDVTGLAREFENSRGSKTLEAKRTAG